MTVKEQLHAFVDRLTDERAADALVYLHRLVDEAGQPPSAIETLARRMGPPMMSGREVFSRPAKDWRTLAAEQGVRPLERCEDLLGEEWPADRETADEMIAAIREWRREGGHA